MNREISFKFCLAILKRAWIVMLAVIIVASALAGVITEYVMEKKYSSSVTFYVINRSSKEDYTSSSVVAALDALAENYMELLKTDKVVEPIAKQLEEAYGVKYSVDQLKKMLSTKAIQETALIELKVTHTDPDVAYKIATLFSESAPALVTDIEKIELVTSSGSTTAVTECIKTVNTPRLNKSPDSPSMVKNLLLAVLLSVVTVYGIYFVMAIVDTTVKTEEDVKAIFGEYPLMAVIPNWNN